MNSSSAQYMIGPGGENGVLGLIGDLALEPIGVGQFVTLLRISGIKHQRP